MKADLPFVDLKQPPFKDNPWPPQLAWFARELVERSAAGTLLWRAGDEKRRAATLDESTIVMARKSGGAWLVSVTHKGVRILTDVAAPDELVTQLEWTADDVSDLLKEVMGVKS